MNDLQSRIDAIKAECEEIIRLDKLAEPAPWYADTFNCEAETRKNYINCGTECNTEFIAHSRNVSPAMARVVLMAIDDGIAQGDSCFLEIIADRWDGK